MHTIETYAQQKGKKTIKQFKSETKKGDKKSNQNVLLIFSIHFDSNTHTHTHTRGFISIKNRN